MARAAARMEVPGAGSGSVSVSTSPGAALKRRERRDLHEFSVLVGDEELDVEHGQTRPVGARTRCGEADLDLVAALGQAQARDGCRRGPQGRPGIALLAAAEA